MKRAVIFAGLVVVAAVGGIVLLEGVGLGIPEPAPWGGVIYGLQNTAGPDPSGLQITGVINTAGNPCISFAGATVGNIPSVDGSLAVWLDNHPSHSVSLLVSRSPSIDGIPKIDRWVSTPTPGFSLVATWNTASGLPATSITVLPTNPPGTLYVVTAEGPTVYTYDALSTPTPGAVVATHSCPGQIATWNQLAVGSSGGAIALGTDGNGVAYMTCIPQPGVFGCDCVVGLRAVPVAAPGLNLVNEDLCYTAAGRWVVTQTQPGIARLDGAIHSWDPVGKAWISHYTRGGRRLFPVREFQVCSRGCMLRGGSRGLSWQRSSCSMSP